MTVGRNHQDVTRATFQNSPVNGQVVPWLHGCCDGAARDVGTDLDGADIWAEIADPTGRLVQGGDIASRKAGEDVSAPLNFVLDHFGYTP